jgi:hypothetical protein
MLGNSSFDPQNYLCVSYDSNNKKPFSTQTALTSLSFIAEI